MTDTKQTRDALIENLLNLAGQKKLALKVRAATEAKLEQIEKATAEAVEALKKT